MQNENENENENENDKAALVDKEAARQAELSKGGDMKEQGFTKPALTAAAKSLCVPFNQPPMPEGQLCFTELGRSQGKLATKWCLWGRSY